jgi:hypothetical protein
MRATSINPSIYTTDYDGIIVSARDGWEYGGSGGITVGI